MKSTRNALALSLLASFSLVRAAHHAPAAADQHPAKHDHHNQAAAHDACADTGCTKEEHHHAIKSPAVADAADPKREAHHAAKHAIRIADANADHAPKHHEDHADHHSADHKTA